MHRAVSLAALPLALLLAPTAVAGQASSPTSSPTRAYGVRVGEGMVRARAGDHAGAIESFRAAVEMQPSRPDAVCLLAAARRAAGDAAAALEGFQACARVARAAAEPRWIARALHGVAATLERLGRLEEARAAWQELVRFAEGAPDAAPAALGRSRITAIDQVVELERVTAEVRQRIAEREAQRTQQTSSGR